MSWSSCYGCSDTSTTFFGDHSFDGETFLPKESFYNGEAAYLLNQSSATWGQNLSSENSLPNPCASDKYKVYKGCTGYTNDASEAHHNVKNGFCTNAGCDYYEKPHYNETDRVYEISNAGQLYAYADNAQTVYTKGARLTADIVVNEGTLIQEDGTPVAKTDDIRMWDEVFRTSGYPYNNQKLVFDGNNHSISGLYANGSGPQGFALYNYGMIKNLQIKNSVFISTDGNAGGIVAGFPIGPADYKECLLAFLRFVLEFCRPRGSKKRGVFVAQQGAFCKQPLLFQHLCLSYVFSHRFTLSLRNGRAPYLWQSVILHFFEFFFRKIHRGHLRYGFICSRETKNGRTMLCGIVRPLADADRKTVLL